MIHFDQIMHSLYILATPNHANKAKLMKADKHTIDTQAGLHILMFNAKSLKFFRGKQPIKEAQRQFYCDYNKKNPLTK